MEYPTQFCLNCGEINADACFVYFDDELKLFFFRVYGQSVFVEKYSFSAYPDSLRNSVELIAERIHWRRIKEVIVSGVDFKEQLCAEIIQKYSLSDVKIIRVKGELNEILENIKSNLLLTRKLRKVNLRPEEKIGGSHTTIIGGREGRKLLHKVAKCEYVKKIIPGVIEGCSTSSGGGVRLKLTRSDEKGNIKAILIDGTSVQKILIITTASCKDEGEFIRKMLSEG